MEPTNQPQPAAPPPAQPDPDADANALEQAEAPAAAPVAQAPVVRPKLPLKQRLQKFNIYLLLFIFIIVLAFGVVMVAYFQSKDTKKAPAISSQNLTQDALDTLASTDASIGDPKQLLSVQSNAAFAGQVLVRGAIEVAGGLRVAGTTVLNDLTTSGPAVLDQAQVNKTLSIGGDTTMQGNLAVQRNLQVSGSGSFSGPVTTSQISTSSLQLSGDLTLTNHIIAGGPSPNRTNGAALGSGGSSSVGGSDTGGTINVNTGGSPPAGCFASITFAKRYNSTPRVIVTPVGAAAGAINYYVTRNAASFSICTASPPPAGASFAFDYFVVE